MECNNRLSFTVNELQEATGIEINNLQQVISTLIGCGLLACGEDEGEDSALDKGRSLSPNTVVSLCEDYESQKVRININVDFRSGKQKDSAPRTKL